MKSAKQFVDELVTENQTLFKASAMQVKAYFESNPSKEELVDHFTGRMVNERMNLVEISKKITEMPGNTSVEELQMLAKQAMDESIHYHLVKEVIEHLTEKEVDLQAAIDSWETRITSKGAALIKKFNAHEDEIAMALYQCIAEGRAEAVWDQMAETIQDDFISSRYARVARDEGFHSNIGKWKLAQLCTTQEAQDHASALAMEMRKELYKISCINTKAVPEARKMMETAYNYTYEV
jgi:predicted transcriptional regulator